MTISTYDAQRNQYTVEYGAKPKRDMVKITAYLKLRAERAKRARAVQAAPTGPKSGELDGVILGTTTGAKNLEATGCRPVDWQDPKTHRVPVFRPVALKPAPKPVVVKPVEVEGILTGTSGIGAKPVNRFAANPCGPTPVQWVDLEKKGK